MAHQWEYQENSTYRRCTRCGTEQTRSRRYAFLRVVGYTNWRPLAGRCPADRVAPAASKGEHHAA